ncbi:hypothetical protein J4573_34470 [Actinomadura barringtoniae]|uniref:Uncharacterized protein n=1 Tax=Actinomadura barringtoniae TaxID=1427535 RepID=A0A939PLG9_9ACTN|nr:hypothetical protein [Actinomadura barringtoniae]MBO2452238.1 hypothetical protein [Actinomadura barringtoniae]
MNFTLVDVPEHPPHLPPVQQQVQEDALPQLNVSHIARPYALPVNGLIQNHLHEFGMSRSGGLFARLPQLTRLEKEREAQSNERTGREDRRNRTIRLAYITEQTPVDRPLEQEGAHREG